MKKLMILACAFIISATATQSFAQTTDAQKQARVKYYYYPSQNVYYNTVSSDYWYYDMPTTTWSTIRTLPANVTVSDDDKYVLWYNGTDPWKNNAADIKKYKVRKDGSIKTKPMNGN